MTVVVDDSCTPFFRATSVSSFGLKSHNHSATGEGPKTVACKRMFTARQGPLTAQSRFKTRELFSSGKSPVPRGIASMKITTIPEERTPVRNKYDSYELFNKCSIPMYYYIPSGDVKIGFQITYMHGLNS